MAAILYNTSEKFRQDERIVDVVVCNVAGSIIIGRNVETSTENDKANKVKGNIFCLRYKYVAC
jgi:hypothetical protein